MNMHLPLDAGFVVMMRDLARHGARQAGCAEARVEAFAAQVERAARELLDEGAAGGGVPVTVRCEAGPLEFTIGKGAAMRRMTLEL